MKDTQVTRIIEFSLLGPLSIVSDLPYPVTLPTTIRREEIGSVNEVKDDLNPVASQHGVMA